MLRRSIVTLSLLAMVACCSQVNGENFRMETDVFVGNQKKPICQTLTLFTDTMVYDFIYGPADDEKHKEDQQVTEVTVFDMSSSRVILLDMIKSRKTVLTQQQLIEMTTAMKVHAAEKNDVYGFAADPKFESKFVEEKLQLTLSSPNLIYDVKGSKPQRAPAAWRYQEFADWSARLNACRPGNLPPFARIELGKQLAERGLIPEEITRTTIAPGRLGSKRLELSSRHHVNWIISTKDRKRIASVAEQIGKFEGVTFLSFIEAEKLK